MAGEDSGAQPDVSRFAHNPTALGAKLFCGLFSI